MDMEQELYAKVVIICQKDSDNKIKVPRYITSKVNPQDQDVCLILIMSG